MIQLNNISKTFRSGLGEISVLNDITFSIEKGEFVSIMGPSGSGKSTLMNILGLLDRSSEGSYFLDDDDVATVSEDVLAKLRNEWIGFVFQHFHLLPRLNIVKNVEIPLIYSGMPKRERVERCHNALEKVGLSDRLSHLPNQLSGGQKQRVAIARALVNTPKIILADEPTGALDTNTGKQIMDLLTDLNKEGATIVIITHEREVASYTNRVLQIRDGRLTEEGEVVHDVNR